MVSVFTNRYRCGILLKQDSCSSDNLALTYCSQIQWLVGCNGGPCMDCHKCIHLVKCLMPVVCYPYLGVSPVFAVDIRLMFQG
jgi:hypothetical protein